MSQAEDSIRRKAIDPKASVWVSANAGSGKTTILTRRVISLLLSGVDPTRILCLTYTRAAAAEMQNRIFDELSRWVRLETTQLSQAIAHIEGFEPSLEHIGFARRLFARAVETPGGLKIQTIHAFCERLLHLFPFEANVPASFRLMDEGEHRDILESCIAELQSHLLTEKDTQLSADISRVTLEAGEYGFVNLIRETLTWKRKKAETDGYDSTVEEDHEALAQALGTSGLETKDSIVQDIAFGQVPDFHHGNWQARLATKNKRDKDLAEDLDKAGKIKNPQSRAEHYISALLTKDLRVNSQKPTGELEKKNPSLYLLLKDEQTRLVQLIQKQFAADCYQRTCALMNVANEVMAVYAQAKRRQGLLDFDDVIHRTNLLLLRASSAWVLYKLDGGIDHLLIDEAQDTSPEQWSILTQLTAEFYSGHSVRNLTRTVFAVGDEKQSIYSFQGAEPAAFALQKKNFRAKAETIGQSFNAVELQLSFRSTDDILSAVDETFASSANFQGLSGDDPKSTIHETTRIGQAGLVEIWPPEVPDDLEDQDPHAEVDAILENSPDIKLAKRIAARIAFWIKSGTRFENAEKNGKSKRIAAGDILILVRKRSVFFNAVIRALKSLDVPVAGADRLKLVDHIAVQDLLCIAECALLPDDDLKFAIVLKCPLIGLNDDDLTLLCANRGETSLFEALSLNPVYAQAYNHILYWQHLAKGSDPYTFFSTILSANEGRKHMLARLGQDAAEAIDVFLNDTLSWQIKNIPSLFQFLSFMRNTDREVKREFDNAVDCVRIMTVHASKGLEARIVFLADTFSPPNGQKTPKLFKLNTDTSIISPDIMAWSSSKAEDPPALLEARSRLLEDEHDEYRRLLYVGMTRAKDRLYIAGFVGKQKPAEAAWFSVVQNALGSGKYLKELPSEDGSGAVWQWRSVPLGSSIQAEDKDVKSFRHNLPDWLINPLPFEVSALPPLRPSSPLQAAEQASSRESDQGAQRRGLLIHMLLQHLGSAAPEKQMVLADRLLTLKAHDLPEAERTSMRNQVCALLQKPEMNILFGPESRAEVTISGTLVPGQPIMARIDRLAVFKEEVLIIDFKTGKPQISIPEDILRQLSLYRALVKRIYPGKKVRAGIIWTSHASLVFASDEELDLLN